MSRRITGQVTTLSVGQVFVFGSNEAGRHGKGAAATARKWGAKNGVGAGLMGHTYGIPTKDARMKTLPLRAIYKYVVEFLNFAQSRPDLQFLVTEIGCGLAGYSPKDIAPMFFELPLPENIWLPERFWEEEWETNPFTLSLSNLQRAYGMSFANASKLQDDLRRIRSLLSPRGDGKGVGP